MYGTVVIVHHGRFDSIDLPRLAFQVRGPNLTAKENEQDDNE